MHIDIWQKRVFVLHVCGVQMAAHAAQCAHGQKMELVNCSHRAAGCQQRVRQMDLEQHMNDEWRSHLDVALRTLAAQQVTIAGLQATNDAQRTIIADLHAAQQTADAAQQATSAAQQITITTLQSMQAAQQAAPAAQQATNAAQQLANAAQQETVASMQAVQQAAIVAQQATNARLQGALERLEEWLEPPSPSHKRAKKEEPLLDLVEANVPSHKSSVHHMRASGDAGVCVRVYTLVYTLVCVRPHT